MQVKDFPATRVRRYPNSLSTFNLLKLTISGDIELNPGLGNKPATCKPAWKFSCDVCTKPVDWNQKCIMCDGCKKWFHLMCITMELWKYLELSSSDQQWFCNGNAVGPLTSIFDQLMMMLERMKGSLLFTLQLDIHPTLAMAFLSAYY